jgi:thiol-disulfide isomerase/thioredoxin
MLLITMLAVLFGCGDNPAPNAQTPSADAVMEAPEAEKAPEKKTAGPMSTLTKINEAGLAALLRSSSDENPRVQVISFWATWCTPCIVEIVLLNALATIHKDVEFVLVNIDHPSLLERRVIPFLRERQLKEVTMYHLDDPDPNVTLAKLVPNWPDSIPVTLIKDKAGIIQEQFNESAHRPQLEEALKRVSH